MRRLFVALIAAAVVLSLAGCKSDDGETATPGTTAETPAGQAAGGGGGQDQAEEVEDDSPLVDGYPVAFPTDPQVVPQDILDRIEAGQPLLIYYFDKDHNVVDDLDGQIEIVMDEYRGLIHEIDYGVASDMEVVVEYDESLGEELSEDERVELRKVYRLADELGVGFTPFIILVDREGTITWMNRGYVDADTLELKVLYATQ